MKPSSSKGTFYLRGQEYILSLHSTQEAAHLQVEHCDHGDVWAGSFSPKYIEDLSQKTGNFKRYEVFVCMLHTAIDDSTEETSEVSLDLMTYADLEELRANKMGLPPSSNRSAGSASKRSNKRFLIITYTTKFDKIHYPLPLGHKGGGGKVPPGEKYQAAVEEKQFVDRLQSDGGWMQLKQELELSAEKIRVLESENYKLKQENKRLKDSSESGRSLRQEVDSLHNLVHNLEADLLAEKSKAKKTTVSKRNVERELREEVAELKSSERLLKVRLRQLTEELTIFKRGRPSVERRPRSAGNSPHASPRLFPNLPRPRSRSSSFPRFDPSAYVKKVEDQRNASRDRKNREIAARLNSPRGSISSLHSRGSSRGSGYESPSGDEGSVHRRPSRHQRPSRRDTVPKVKREAQGYGKQKRTKRISPFHYEEDILDIDERLNRLQDFLSKNLLVRS